MLLTASVITWYNFSPEFLFWIYKWMKFISICFHSIVFKPCQKINRSMFEYFIFSGFLSTVYGVLSSVWPAISTSYMKRNRSHKKILNKSGPKIEPCRTPNSISSQEPETDSGLVKLVVMTNVFFNNQQHEIKTRQFI